MDEQHGAPERPDGDPEGEYEDEYEYVWEPAFTPPPEINGLMSSAQEFLERMQQSSVSIGDRAIAELDRIQNLGLPPAVARQEEALRRVQEQENAIMRATGHRLVRHHKRRQKIPETRVAVSTPAEHAPTAQEHQPIEQPTTVRKTRGRRRVIKDKSHFEQILRDLCDIRLHAPHPQPPSQSEISASLGIYDTSNSTVRRAAHRHFDDWESTQAYCRDYLASKGKR